LRGGATRHGCAIGTHLTLSLHHALLFAIHRVISRSYFVTASKTIFAQGRRDSNPQPPVLETGALPIEPLPSVDAPEKWPRP
jgi:hypothetical protein